MTQQTLFPLGQFAFLLEPLDRAAHVRDDADKLFALEGKANSRAYVVHRDSIVVKQEGDGVRAALTIKEALALGANPGTIFLGLRDGTPYFGMGIPQQVAEKLPTQDGIAVEPLRNLATQGLVLPNELSAIATAKSLVHWHQRHGFCPNCGARTQMAHGGWKRECPNCKSEHFPRTDPVVIMLVTDGERCLLGRQKQFIKGMWSCLAGFVEPAETIEDAVRREIYEEAGIECTDVRYYKAQPWPFPYSLMIGCTARAVTTDLKVDRNELEDARWFSRSEVNKMMTDTHPDGHRGPNGIAIAHHLLGQWASEAPMAEVK
jgi:NAD+ diphosphatase